MRTCESCRYMDGNGFMKGYGRCRRNPPTDDESWPATSADNWCGEWKETLEVEQARHLEQVTENMRRIGDFHAPGTGA